MTRTTICEKHDIKDNVLISKEDIFFGFIREDGTRESLVHSIHSITVMRLLIYSNQYPEQFTTRCECGKSAIVYSHTISHEPENTLVSRIHYFCPECGRKGYRGANWMLARMRVNILNHIEESMFGSQSI